MLKSIEEEWRGFAAMVIPSLTPESIQYTEMKKAFFAGALVVNAAIYEIASPNVSEEDGKKYLANVKDELVEFRNQLWRQYVERN